MIRWITNRQMLGARMALLIGALTILGDCNRAFGKPPAKGNGPGAVVLHTYETEFGTEVMIENTRRLLWDLWRLLKAAGGYKK